MCQKFYQMIANSQFCACAVKSDYPKQIVKILISIQNINIAENDGGNRDRK